MRVLIVSQYFWPENFRVNDLSQGLHDRGHHVTILTGLPNYPSGVVSAAYRANPEQFSEYAGAQIYRVPILPRGKGSMRLLLNYLSFVVSGCLLGAWQLRGQQFDVIFVFQPSPVTVALPAILIGRFKKTPVVLWVMDLWPESLAAIGVVKSPKLLALVGLMVSFIYRRCALVLGQSKSFVTSIANYCPNRAKIRCLFNWAEDLFTQNNIAFAPEIKIEKDVFSVLFAGNVGETQDFPAILAAAECLKHDTNVRWLIVGDGRMSEWLRCEVNSRGLSHCVLLLGRFEVERMPSFYAHAGALLVSLKKDPAFSLTIPGKVQSYLMAGKPLLGMLDGEGAAVITEANAGLACAAGDGVGLARIVKQMAAMDVATRQKLGQSGRAFAEKTFERNAIFNQLESYFSELVSEKFE